MPPLTFWEYGTVDRRPVNADFFADNSYWKRSLAADTPLWSLSNEWARNLCTQMGFDPDTSQSQPFPDHLPGSVPGQAWIRQGDPVYIVDDQVPLRSFTNQNNGVTAWDTRWQAVVDELGGIPIPLDAQCQQTPDKYMYVYQPSTDIFVEMSYLYALDFATTTISCPSATSGSFQVRINYADNIQIIAQDFTTPAINWNDSNDTVAAKFCAATNGPGQRIDRFTPGLIDVLSGGPLPNTPVVLRYWIATPMRNIPATIINSTVNGTGATKAEHPSGPLAQCYHGGVVAPGHGFSGISGFDGTYEDRVYGGSNYWMDRRMGGAATSICYTAGLPSLDEAIYANDNNIGLDHAVTLLTGNAQNGFAGTYPYVWPATRSDGDLYDDNAIAQGARVRFPADVDLSHVQANYPEWMWMARTIRDKGAIIYDRTHGGCELTLRQQSFTLADGTTPTDGWGSFLTQYLDHGDAAHIYMQALPWHKAQVVSPDFSLPTGGGEEPAPPGSTGAYFGVPV